MKLTKSAAKWGRPAHSGRGAVVAFPVPLPLGVAAELLAVGLTAKQFFPMTSDSMAVFFEGSPEAVAKLLKVVPLPKSHGSRTAGNLLPK